MIRDDKRIESIRLVGVGPFEDTTINFPTNSRKDLAEVHIFTGGNGEGKSTLLFALASIFSHAKNHTQRPFHDLVRRMHSKNAIISGRCFGGDYEVMASGKHRVSSQSQEFGSYDVFRNDELIEFAKLWNTKAWRKNTYSLLPLAYSGYRSWGLDIEVGETSLQAVSESPLKDHLSFGDTVDPWLIAQWIANQEAKEALAFKRKLVVKASVHRTRSTRDTLIEAISSIAAGRKIEFELDSDTLVVGVLLDGQRVPFDTLPSGLKSIISWVADLLVRMDRLPWENPDAPLLEQPLLLFLDEIDIHLHPSWQSSVLPVIQKLFRNAQIFVSTHSPFVVASVEDAWVYEMSRGEKNSDGSFVVKAEKSGAGKSYELVLADTFGITERFVDPETNRLLDAMRAERDALFGDKAHSPLEFLRVTDLLAQRSEQLARIVGLECRQLAKHGIDLTVTKS